MMIFHVTNIHYCSRSSRLVQHFPVTDGIVQRLESANGVPLTLRRTNGDVTGSETSPRARSALVTVDRKL